ncbi:MAG: hypothetical protein EXX96DRAFT_650518 [Benjaminiella poitrasii]|nr:MAG: hypothetical protein EXX96DRAFT_650518 [Benjaminiella poitrasii]
MRLQKTVLALWSVRDWEGRTGGRQLRQEGKGIGACGSSGSRKPENGVNGKCGSASREEFRVWTITTRLEVVLKECLSEMFKRSSIHSISRRIISAPK